MISSLLPQTFHIDLPNDLFSAVQKCKTDGEAREVGIEWASKQSKELIKIGVPGIHYYTLGDLIILQDCKALVSRRLF